MTCAFKQNINKIPEIVLRYYVRTTYLFAHSIFTS